MKNIYLMNTAELIHKLGPELGVYGVAVHAFVEASPGCRYDEIMAGLSMSKAQVLRTVTKLEEVGAVERDKGDSSYGMSKPTRVRCLSQQHPKSRVSPSATPVNTDASDNPAVKPGVSQVHTVADGDTRKVAVSLTETPVNTAAALSDASNNGCRSQRHPQKQGKQRGTPIAPLSAETISSNTVEANASTASDAAGLKFYVGRLIQFRESKLGTKLPKHQAEAAAAKWMFEQGWAIEDVMNCHDFLVGQGRNWRHTGVTLNEVKSQIADWKRGNLTDGTRAGPQRNGRASNVEKSMDALKSFIAKERANVR